MNTYIESLYMENDRRNCTSEEVPVLYSDDGEEIELPTRWEPCSVCDGNGAHVRSSIDCNGLTESEMDADPDFAAGYRRGVFDERCNKCNGRKRMLAVDWDQLDDETTRTYRQQLDDDAKFAATCAAELANGA